MHDIEWQKPVPKGSHYMIPFIWHYQETKGKWWLQGWGGGDAPIKATRGRFFVMMERFCHLWQWVCESIYIYVLKFIEVHIHTPQKSIVLYDDLRHFFKKIFNTSKEGVLDVASGDLGITALQGVTFIHPFPHEPASQPRVHARHITDAQSIEFLLLVNLSTGRNQGLDTWFWHGLMETCTMAGWRRLERVALGSHTGKVKDGFALRASVCSFRSLEEIVLPASSVLKACLGNQVPEKVCDP